MNTSTYNKLVKYWDTCSDKVYQLEEDIEAKIENKRKSISKLSVFKKLKLNNIQNECDIYFEGIFWHLLLGRKYINEFKQILLVYCNGNKQDFNDLLFDMKEEDAAQNDGVEYFSKCPDSIESFYIKVCNEAVEIAFKKYKRIVNLINQV